MIKQLLNLATTPQMIIENFEGWGSQKPKFLYEISGVSGGVGRGSNQKAIHGRVWTFSGTTHCQNNHSFAKLTTARNRQPLGQHPSPYPPPKVVWGVLFS